MQTETSSNLIKTQLSPDGYNLGQSVSDLVGLYGVTPVDQPASASEAAVSPSAVTAIGTTTVSAANTSAVWGFSSSTAARALVVRVRQLQVDSAAIVVLLNQLRSDLVSIGAIKGSS